MHEHGKYLRLALDQAEQAAREGTYPIGAVIVGQDGAVISSGRSRVYTAGDVTGHAEVDAIRRAGPALLHPSAGEGWTLYTTVEPCLMCAGAILVAHIGRVVWGMNDHIAGAVRCLQAGPYRPERFARLEVVAAPDPEVDARQRELMIAWDRSRGRDPSRWFASA